MADQDYAVKILIEMGLNDAAARQAVERIDQLKQATTGAEKTASSAAGSMDELGAATEKGVDAAKHLHHEHRLIHTLLHLIGRSEGPMAAGAMAAVGAAAGGGMMLGVQAVSMFGEAIKQTVEEIKKLKEEARTAFTDIQTLTNQTKTAMDDLKFASDNYWDGLARKSADSGVKAAFAGELAQIGLMTTAAKNLVVELQKAGLITAEQADKKTADDDAAGKAAEAAAKAKRAGELGENITALSEQAKKLQEEKSGERAAQIMNEQENIKHDQEMLSNAYDKNTKFVPRSQALIRATAGPDSKNLNFIEGETGEDDNERKEKEIAFAKILADASQKNKDSTAEFDKHLNLVQDRIQKMQEEKDALDQAVASFNQQVPFTALAAAQKRMEGKDANQVIAAGATATEDEKLLSQQGYDEKRINREGEAAETNKAVGLPFDKNAIDRMQRFAADKEAVDSLNDLLTTLGEQQSKMLTIIRFHGQGHSALQKEIADVQNQYKLILQTIVNSGFKNSQ